MKVLIVIGHPAHFHLFKNLIDKLQNNGHRVKIAITEKDLLTKLLEENNYEYVIISARKKNENIIDKAIKIIKSSIKLNRLVDEFKPDVMAGCLTQMALISRLRRVPSFFIGEDDINYTMLQGIITYPFIFKIIAPELTKVGFFKYKKIGYCGFQKLTYLHPNCFESNLGIIPEINNNRPYFLFRLVNLNAYHDKNILGLSESILDRIIERLQLIGTIYISSENSLGEKYHKYKLPIKTSHIHHLIYFADIYIGDSQSMAVEAAMLGTPSIRFNDFAGKISVLEELEHKYQLTFGIKPSEPEKLFQKIEELLATPDLKAEFQKRRQKMLDDKIDVTAFMVWFIENYPQSAKTMKENPDFQYKFK